MSSAHASEAYAPGMRVLVDLSTGPRKARVVSKVTDVDAYVVATTTQRMTIQGRHIHAGHHSRDKQR